MNFGALSIHELLVQNLILNRQEDWIDWLVEPMLHSLPGSGGDQSSHSLFVAAVHMEKVNNI